jgi:hypothetical protein
MIEKLYFKEILWGRGGAKHNDIEKTSYFYYGNFIFDRLWRITTYIFSTTPLFVIARCVSILYREQRAIYG